MPSKKGLSHNHIVSIFHARETFSFVLESKPLKWAGRLSSFIKPHVLIHATRLLLPMCLFTAGDNLQLPFLSTMLKGLKL